MMADVRALVIEASGHSHWHCFLIVVSNAGQGNPVVRHGVGQ